MLATFERDKESRLWFPVLKQHDFTELRLATNKDDHENAIDAIGHNLFLGDVNCALRSRDEGRQPSQYKKEFTIRYRRPSGVSVEWQKFFEKDLPRRPDFFVYGWTQGKSIGDYVILGVSVLRDLYNAGHLNKYIERIKQNTNGLASEFVPIPISELISLPEALGLIAFHSDNHPALS